MSTNVAVDHAPSGLVAAEVVRAERISPSFVRVTLSGDALASWRYLGYDQWFRLALPLSDDTRFDTLSQRFDVRGYLKYLTLPKATRPVIRSYTVREFRPERLELDVDFLTHGTAGIAGPWAASLPVGSPVGLIDQGCGFTAGDAARRVLCAGDESAMPALLGVLRDLPSDAVGDVIIEVPDLDDRQPTSPPAGVNVHWITRDRSARPGSAALAALTSFRPAPAAAQSQELHAFVAGEQQLASGGRRYLVNDLGVPKTHVKFCGYWRQR